MIERKPNHICNNPYCNKGIDGQPKHYYACDYCDRINTWKAYACSVECYKDILAINTGKKQRPNRTDISEKELDKLMNKDIKEVKQDTLKELSDMKEEIAEGGIDKAVEVINKKIDSKSKSKNKTVKNAKNKK